MLRGIRGATTVEKNTVEDLKPAVIELLEKIIVLNEIDTVNIASITFTMTADLTCAYPAKFAREIDGISNVPLMCYQELNIENSLEKCIRVLVLLNTSKTQKDIKHVYLHKAKNLRPDLYSNP